MTDLSSKHCKACEGGDPALSKEKVQQHLKEVSEWQLSKDQKSISRRFKFKGFNRTMLFVNALAWIVNEEGHHPTLEIGYDYCQVLFTTHAIDGLSENDFICAAKIDALISSR